MLPHPPYSLDLAPCNFCLYPKLKTHLKGHHFGMAENVKAAVTRALNNISSEDCLHCYKEWQQLWNCLFNHKEPILKGINCNYMYVQQTFFFKSFSLLLGETSCKTPDTGMQRMLDGNPL